MRLRLPKSIPNSQFSKNNEPEDGEVEEEDEIAKDASKKSTTLAAILSKAPPKFPWLFPQTANGDLKKDLCKNDEQLKPEDKGEIIITDDEKKRQKEEKREQKKAKKVAKKNKKLEKEIRKRMIEAKRWRKTEVGDVDEEKTPKSTAKKKHRKRKREKEEEEENSESEGSKKTEKSEKKVKRKHKTRRSSSQSRTNSRGRSLNGVKTTAASSRSRPHDSARNSSRSSSSYSRHGKQRNRSNSSERTYSSISPPRRRSRSRSYSPLPPFNRQRAMQTRRRLIEESWHRRIEQSVRPMRSISPIRHRRPSRLKKEKSFDKSDYMDEKGEIDKQKLLDIATKNATKLAMEGKLPKGAELIDTIKNKSVEHLIALCKKLQTERDLLPKGSSSDEDEEKRYSRKYEDWRERRDRSKDREFRNRGVMAADHPSRQKYVERDRREIKKREDTTLRLTFPVSSGAIHRTKANEPIPKMAAGPLVKYGEIGPLTTALAKVRTSIPAAYRPLSQPLPTAQPSSVLASHFQSTSAIKLGPQMPERPPTPEKKPPPPDIMNSKAYEIVLAALERKAELEKEKTKEPVLATSSNFIGPMAPSPSPIDIIAAAAPFAPSLDLKNAQPSTSANQVPNAAPVNISSKMPEVQKVFTSTWDKPGHIAAREAFLRKIAEQKRQAEETAVIEAKMELENVKKVEETQRQKNEEHLNAEVANPIQSANEVAIPKSDLVEKRECQFKADENGKMESISKEKSSSPTKVNLSKKINANIFVPSASGAPLLLPTTSNPAKMNIGKKDEEKDEGKEEEKNLDLIDKMHAYVESQVARQKAESLLHATILSAQLYQKTPANVPKNEFSTFSISASRSKDPIGLTAPSKSIQELVSTRLKYSQRLQRNPNDFETRKELAKVEEELSKWAYDSTLPGEFTGHTGAKVLSEKELEPNDPRFHAWARKDQFRNVPEICSGVGMRLMEKMGWKQGQGLGRNLAGSIEPLALDVKSDRRGFYSEDHERVPKRESVLDPTGKNPISVLMEVCTRQHWKQPQFYCVESGPQNYKRYHWKAILNGVEYSPSLASSNKRAGKAQVCMVVLEALGMTT